MMRDYKVNDIIWYIPDGYLLAIECVIEDIDDDFRKQEPQATVFYWLSEPVGHGVTDDEIYPNKDEALKELKKRYEEALNEVYYEININEQLGVYRKARIHFIVGTWEECNNKQEEEDRWYNSLESKKYGIQWFNIENIL